MPECQHLTNVTITMYEEEASEITIRNRQVYNVTTDTEPYLLSKVDIACSDCNTTITCDDWRTLPEPLRTYCSRFFRGELTEGDGQSAIVYGPKPSAHKTPPTPIEHRHTSP